MRRSKIVCSMCQREFMGRYGAKTCSPRCRKRRQRVIDGTALATWAMGVEPNPKASKLWR
jgi:hypothetical protein